jgi:hypothetical protein
VKQTSGRWTEEISYEFRDRLGDCPRRDRDSDGDSALFSIPILILDLISLARTFNLGVNTRLLRVIMGSPRTQLGGGDGRATEGLWHQLKHRRLFLMHRITVRNLLIDHLQSYLCKFTDGGARNTGS